MRFVQTFMGFSPSKSKKINFEIVSLLSQIQDNMDNLDDAGDISVQNDSLASSIKGRSLLNQEIEPSKASSSDFKQEFLLISRMKNSKLNLFQFIIMLHTAMAWSYCVIIYLNRTLFNSATADSKSVLNVVDRIFSTMHISTFMESGTLTAMSRPFELYYTFPIMFAIGPFYRGTSPQWSRGIEAIFESFNIEETVSSSLKEIYQGNACDLFEKIKNSTLVGSQKRECS